MATIPWTYLIIDGRRPLDRHSRNIKAQLTRIEAGGDIVRLADGTRRSLRRTGFDKYKVTLSGEAPRKPAMDHLVKGSIVTLGWPGHIDLPGDIDDGLLPRPFVPGSVLRVGQAGGEPTQLPHGDPGVVVTAFRPVLVVMIDNLEVNEDEMNASVSWTLTGEEL